MTHNDIRNEFKKVLPWESDHVSSWTDCGKRGIQLKFLDGSSGIFIFYRPNDWVFRCDDGTVVLKRPDSHKRKERPRNANVYVNSGFLSSNRYGALVGV